MLDLGPLAGAFRACAPPALDGDAGELEAFLSELVDRARSRWPGLDVEGRVLAAYIGQRVDSVDELRKVRASDLYLACACARGQAEALRLFDDEILSKTSGALARLDKQGDLVAEIQQVMRAELLVGSPDDPPRILDYRGQGSLVGWVKVSATRRALKTFRKHKREVALQEWDVGDAIADGELDNLRAMYQREFRVAFETAFTRLSSEQRNLLRLHILDEVAIDGIAELLRVHRATAARRLAGARLALAEETRDVLGELIGARGNPLDSVLGLVRSRLELSIRRILEAESRTSD